MTVPINSAVINGGAYPVVWAEGRLRAGSESAAGADRTAYASLSPANASSSAHTMPVRHARLAGTAEASGGALPFDPVRITPGAPQVALGKGFATGVPYRARQVDGQPAEIAAYLSSPEPARLVRMEPTYRSAGPLNGSLLNGMASWADGLVARSESYSDNATLSARIIKASGVALGHAESPPAAMPVFRVMDPRRMRVASLTFARSQDVERLRVRQIPAGGPAIARAQTRATPNTILGFGWSFGDAESSLSAPDVYVARAAYPGNAEAEAESSTQGHLVRIIEFLFRADANLLAAPDIIRDGARLAFADGVMLAEALSSKPIARRFPLFEPIPSEGASLSTLVPTHEPRSRARHEGEALSRLDDSLLVVLHRVPARPRFAARAQLEAVPTTLRDSHGAAEALSEASITATHLVAQGASGLAEASATAAGHGVSTLYMDSTAGGEAALSATGAWRAAFMSGAPADAMGGTEMVASIYTIVSMVSEKASAGAMSRSVALRARIYIPAPMEGAALIPPRSFKINAGDPAPPQRTLSIPGATRHLSIPAGNREYRIT